MATAADSIKKSFSTLTQDCAHASGKYKCRHQSSGDDHRGVATHSFKTGDGDDNAQSSELKLNVRNHEDEPDNSHEASEILAAVSPSEEVGLSLHPVFAPHLPHLWQDEKGDDVGEGQISQDVQGWSTARVGPAGRAQKGERGVNFTGLQEPHEDQSETATSYGPLLQIHFSAGSRVEADR
jgi:hypothetical protein